MDFQRSVRDRRYKLIRYPAVDHTLLFDLQNDSHELVDLADKLQPLTWDYRTIERKPDPGQPAYLIEKYFRN